MVFRCNGSSPELLDSALAEALNSPFSSVAVNNPVQKGGNKRADQLVTFILIIGGDSYVNGLELFVKQIDGVRRVKGDSNSIKLEVTGMVNPLKVQELVERKTKKKVGLIFPTAKVEGDKDKNGGSEAELKNWMEMMNQNGIANEHTEESMYVLKIKLCCDSCNRKLRKILKIKGLETVSMDVDKDLIKVKGTVDMTAVVAYIKDELKKNVDIIFPAEVVIPAKKDRDTAYEKEKDVTLPKKKERNTEVEATNMKDQVTANKKEKDAGFPRKKDRNIEGEAKNKKEKGCNAAFKGKNRGPVTVDRKLKGTTAVYAKSEDIAAFNMKDKGRNAAFDGKNRRIVPVDEKFEGTTAVYEKSEGIAAVNVKDKGTKEADENLKGSSTVVDKHKDYAVNYEKDEGGIKDTEVKTFGGARVGRGECSGGRYSDDGGAMRRENVRACSSYDETRLNVKVNHTYEYNWHQWFSDENPHSCCIM